MFRTIQSFLCFQKKIHLNFKGRELRLTEVQKAGIGRQTTKGVGLLAHEVGFWKNIVWNPVNARSDGKSKCEKTADCRSQ